MKDDIFNNQPLDKVYPKRKPDIVCKTADTETILYNPGINSIYALNNTSTWIWNCCDGSKNLKELEKTLREKYETDTSDDVMNDVKRVIQDFIEYQLIVIN